MEASTIPYVCYGVPVVTAIITFALTRLYGARDSKKNKICSRVTDLESQIWELSNLGATYWSRLHKKDDRLNIELQIKSLRKKIGIELTSLKKSAQKSCIMETHQLGELNKKITSSPFEENELSAQPQRISEIHDATEMLINTLRGSFQRYSE